MLKSPEIKIFRTGIPAEQQEEGSVSQTKATVITHTKMSWLMSAKRRATEGLLQAVGAHHATEDAEFDQKLRNFTDQVNHLQKVKDSMDLWVESFDTFGAATMMLSESFKGFFAFKPTVDSDLPPPSASPYLDVSDHFVDIVKKLNRVILPSVRQLFELRCLQPTTSILSLVGPIDSLLQERKTVLLDFDSYRAKIEREHAAGRDSRHPLVVKKAIKLDEVAKQLHALNTSICASFVEFEKARLITLGPEFTAFVACFYHFTSHSTELASKVVPGLPQIASSLYTLESFIGQSFADISNLTVSPVRFPPTEPAQQGADPRDDSEPLGGSVTSGEGCVSGGVCGANDSGGNSGGVGENAPEGVVLSRSEYAGGGYGGYASHSTAMPASYKDSQVEQAVLGAAAADMESAKSSGDSDSLAGSPRLPRGAEEADGGSVQVTLLQVGVAYAEVELAQTCSANGGNSSTILTGACFSAQIEVTSASSTEETGELVPITAAPTDRRPPKPSKPAAANRTVSPVPLFRSTSGGSSFAILDSDVGEQQAGGGTREVVSFPTRGSATSSATESASIGEGLSSPTYRNTIALAKGSGGSGDLTEDLALRSDLTPSPPPKPLKPPKPTRSPLAPPVAVDLVGGAEVLSPLSQVGASDETCQVGRALDCAAGAVPPLSESNESCGAGRAAECVSSACAEVLSPVLQACESNESCQQPLESQDAASNPEEVIGGTAEPVAHQT